MRYTEDDLKKMCYPMGEGFCEATLAKFELCARGYYEQGYKNYGPLQRMDSSSAYYRLPLIDSAQKPYFLEVQGAYALDVVVTKCDKQSFALIPEDDDSFKKLYDEYQKRNRETDYALKRLIRILKHIYANMLQENIPEAKSVTADDVAGLVFALPDASLKRFSSLSEKLQYVLLQINSSEAKVEQFIVALRAYVQS